MPKRYLTGDLPMDTSTVDVGPGTRFATPFGLQYTEGSDAAKQCERFRDWVLKGPLSEHWDAGLEDWGRWGMLVGSLHQIRGKHLADKQPLDRPSHADVLIEIANGKTIPVISIVWQDVSA